MYLHFSTFENNDDDNDMAKAGELGLGLPTLEQERAAVGSIVGVSF